MKLPSSRRVIINLCWDHNRFQYKLCFIASNCTLTARHNFVTRCEMQPPAPCPYPAPRKRDQQPTEERMETPGSLSVEITENSPFSIPLFGHHAQKGRSTHKATQTCHRISTSPHNCCVTYDILSTSLSLNFLIYKHGTIQ